MMNRNVPNSISSQARSAGSQDGRSLTRRGDPVKDRAPRPAPARERPGAFDLVTCMEMLEHVPDPASTLAALAALVRPGGDVVVSTLNRNPKAFAVAIVGAEYLARVLPRGTHDYLKFIRPSELAGWGRDAGLDLRDLAGISYNPLTRAFRLSSDTSVNYLAHFRRRAAVGAD